MEGWLCMIRASAAGWLPLIKSELPDYVLNDIGHAEKITRINVSGTIFETWESTLEKYPLTLLGSPEREYFYNPISGEYFFDRDPLIFRSILNYYRTGHLHFPKDEIVSLYESELNYFGIPTDALEVCCYEDFMEKKKDDDDKRIDVSGDIIQDTHEHMKFRERLWHDFENPQASIFAQIVHYVSGFFIALSVITNIVETVPCLVSNETDQTISYGMKYESAFFCLDTACVLIFTVEFIARQYAAPNRCQLIKSSMSIIDMAAVFPYYIGLFMTTTLSSAFTTLRVFRVFRIFKFSRHSQGLRILGYTLKSCASELGFLLFSMSMAIIIFSTIMFYAEKSDSSQFTSIPAAFWYTIVTMTTLGYGDIVPVTTVGKIVGGVCSLSGVLVIALPVPVIVSNFARIYQQSQKTENKLKQQLSKSVRLKRHAREQHNFFLKSKLQAAVELNYGSEEIDTEVLKDSKVDIMLPPTNNVTEVKAERSHKLSSTQTQHYHVLNCLELLTALIYWCDRRSSL